MNMVGRIPSAVPIYNHEYIVSPVVWSEEVFKMRKVFAEVWRELSQSLKCAILLHVQPDISKKPVVASV